MKPETYLGFRYQEHDDGTVVACPSWGRFVWLRADTVPLIRRAIWLYWHPETKRG